MDLINLILRKDYCSRCSKLVSKSEFKEDRHRIKWNICKKCQQQLKNLVRKPKAFFWNKIASFSVSDNCIYCKSDRIKKIYTDRFDHTGNIYKCLRCKRRFYAFELEHTHYKKQRKPRPTKQKPIAQLRCRRCQRVFRQDNYKFTQSGRCPSCGYFEFELLRYLPKRKKSLIKSKGK